MEILRTYQLPLQKSIDALDDLESFAESETYSLGTDSTVEFQEGASVTYGLHHVASRRTSVITVILNSTATSEYEQFKKFISALENYKNGKRSIRKLMRSKQIVPGDQISFNLLSAVVQDDGTLRYGSVVVRSAGSFLREILKRPNGGTDYKRLTTGSFRGILLP